MATNGIVQEKENIEDTKGEGVCGCVCGCVCVCVKNTMKVCDVCVPTHTLTHTIPFRNFYTAAQHSRAAESRGVHVG